jgi:hypothetical protein
MASLHDFQAEIDGIHAQEVAKQRARAAAERDKERESKTAAPAKKKATITTGRDASAVGSSSKDDKKPGKVGGKGGGPSKDKDTKDKATAATDDAMSVTEPATKGDEQKEVLDERPNEELEEEIEVRIVVSYSNT